jgi:hypothetical protein
MPPECFLAFAVRVFGRPTDFRCVRGELIETVVDNGEPTKSFVALCGCLIVLSNYLITQEPYPNPCAACACKSCRRMARRVRERQNRSRNAIAAFPGVKRCGDDEYAPRVPRSKRSLGFPTVSPRLAWALAGKASRVGAIATDQITDRFI